jgi:LmbE family N-acetylglucosaminyl deacetylase
MKEDYMRVLAFGAHPDDIELKCGGTLIKMAERGDSIFFCIATNGNIGSFHMTSEEIAEHRYKEAQQSCEKIGAELIWLNENDQFLFDNKETRLKFVDAYRYVKPDIVFAPPPYKDYNQDHDMTGYLAFIARGLAPIKLIETKYDRFSKIPPMFYVQPHGYDPSYTPEYFVDITNVFDKKIELLKSHKSQMGDWCKDAFGVDYLDGVRNTDGYWASCCATPGVERVEVFSICKNWPVVAGAHKLLP